MSVMLWIGMIQAQNDRPDPDLSEGNKKSRLPAADAIELIITKMSENSGTKMF